MPCGTQRGSAWDIKFVKLCCRDHRRLLFVKDTRRLRRRCDFEALATGARRFHAAVGTNSTESGTEVTGRGQGANPEGQDAFPVSFEKKHSTHLQCE